MVLFELMFKLFVTIGLGYFLGKKGMLREETNSVLTDFIIKVTCPALIIYSVCDKVTGEESEVTKLLIFGFVLYAIIIILAKLISRLLHRDGKKRSSYEMLILFGNVSFMGYPIVQSLFGDNAVFYNSVVHMPFNILIFTYGIYLISKGEKEAGKMNAKQIINPGTVASVIALLIYFLPVQVPAFISDTLGFVGNLTTALSLIVLGSILSTYSFTVMKEDKKMIILTAMKLLIIPIIFMVPAITLFPQREMFGTIVISLGMPSASLCVMMSTAYEDKIKTMVIGVVMTTIVSLITIPILYIILGQVAGV